ncbi:5-methyltetrahydropteroyltriglutamate--homocysteine S-methyltransferase [Rhizobium rhizogenes]|uniref:5-methyltetrahydropteroyltriglutamate-- homocysteine S-methyltransferase n=1 Tax=Rhizobium rhizogenes TaxID=359 RepID=UPI001572FC37|nr:5-methyltetrahydropteroyltriglutamate--homocysteine S-methyltransferase [Rhizobium rhizogenes]NTF89774.1 5-methyltetrahydropteroyltriglutamate--homocysteine S-methyltransferase [Rhizobium rhizogenes]
MTILTANLGFPRIGRHRELKFALESCWSRQSDRAALFDVAKTLRADNWRLQKEKGIAVIPSNDFSLYDHVLDTAVMVGAIPALYGWRGGPVDLDTYFAMARGSTGGGHGDCGHVHHHQGAPALEMTKWFDTNYHYMVPEIGPDQAFELTANRPLEMFREARALGIHTRPVLLGPITLLKLAKSKEEDFEPIRLLDRLLPVYARILAELSAAGADGVQIDEPALVLDLTDEDRSAFAHAYEAFHKLVPNLKIMVATYFGAIGDNLPIVLASPMAGLHIDLVRAPEQLSEVLAKLPPNRVLSLGVIDGRNIWRGDLVKALDHLEPVVAAIGADRVQIAPSCSLLHVPIDLELETALDADLGRWLAFATQKLDEVVALGRGLSDGRNAIGDALAASATAAASRASSPKVHDPVVDGRIKGLDASIKRRQNAFLRRKAIQEKRLKLPLFPTTTIGSFPQTAEVRKARAAHGKGTMSYVDYDAFLRKETESAIRWQEEIGLDVLVHGEFERNDMVQYFGEQLSGFAFTQHAWVQSYGSRYVRPPVIYGDVSRPRAMTVQWWRYAQSLTEKPVKGMLTGPVTILNWSFVRNDLSRSAVCRQIALAIRDEVADLEEAGASMIQIDEAALREGLPLRTSDWKIYLDWAVECFRLCSTGVSDETQIHTHMCYSEFNHIIDAIAAMDADVISIETSRSKMELLDAFRTYKYPNEIGPGVYDIHSPRVPEVSEMTELLDLARLRLGDAQLWINPDCGLKTRKWDEVRPALVNMVHAARLLRLSAQARTTASAS